MRTSVGATYGMTALTTDVRYEPSLPRIQDYSIAYPPGDGEALGVTTSLAAKIKESYFNKRMKKIIQMRDDEAKI